MLQVPLCLTLCPYYSYVWQSMGYPCFQCPRTCRRTPFSPCALALISSFIKQHLPRIILPTRHAPTPHLRCIVLGVVFLGDGHNLVNKSSKPTRSNENATLAILGDTKGMQYKWPASMRSLNAWVPVISSMMMGSMSKLNWFTRPIRCVYCLQQCQ